MKISAGIIIPNPMSFFSSWRDVWRLTLPVVENFG